MVYVYSPTVFQLHCVIFMGKVCFKTATNEWQFQICLYTRYYKLIIM
jgi:hypothetical protein